MGKHELLENPLLGIFFRTIDIPVNRDSKISSYKAFKQTGERLEQGMSVVIFPKELYPKIIRLNCRSLKMGRSGWLSN